MRVGVDAEDAAKLQRLLMPAPVEVKPPRMRVGFDGNAILRASFQNFFDVDFVAGTPLELTTRHMPYDCRMRVFDCLEYPFRLLFFRQLEAAVHTCDDEI